MPTVLEHGNTYKKVKCPYCNCVFTFSKKDVKSYNNGNAWLERPATEVTWQVFYSECGAAVCIKKWKKGDGEEKRHYE